MDKVSFVKVRKTLKVLPAHILRNLQRWAMQVEMLGMNYEGINTISIEEINKHEY
jgi:hypothetical protein